MPAEIYHRRNGELITRIYKLDCDIVKSSEISQYLWNKNMEGAEKFSYKDAIELIDNDLPELYNALELDLHNFQEESTYITDEHIIITHDGIEYFIPYTTLND